MSNCGRVVRLTVACLMLFALSPAEAAIDVLWYTGGVEVSGGSPGDYEDAIGTTLVVQAATGGGRSTPTPGT